MRRSTRCPRTARSSSGSGPRCAATCASSRAARRRDRLHPRVALPRRRATRRASSPSGAATRSASARSSAKDASEASCAPTSTTAQRRSSPSRPSTGRTRGCGPTPARTSSQTGSPRFCWTGCAATPRTGLGVQAVLVVNPFASRVTDARLSAIEHELSRVADLTVVTTEWHGHATELVTAACRAGTTS